MSTEQYERPEREMVEKQDLGVQVNEPGTEDETALLEELYGPANADGVYDGDNQLGDDLEEEG
jgi:hypothetical protein